MSVPLGISPIGWSNNDLPELGGDIPLGTCLAEAREAGFEEIELGHKFPRDPALLQSLLGDHELHLVSGWYNGRLLERSVAEELVAIEPHRALLAAMGSAVLVYAETSGGIAGDRTRPLSRRPSLPNGHWRDFGIRLTELADRLAERGIRLAYHHHMGTVVETADEIDRLMASTGGSVGLLLDTGHLAFCRRRPGRYCMAAWTAHQPCPLQGRPARCAGTRSRGRSELSRLGDRRRLHRAGRRRDRFRRSARRAQGSKLPRLARSRGGAGPGKAPPLVYARRGFAYLSAALRDMGW
jgi:sugar phosphate isomerase/epimerase